MGSRKKRSSKKRGKGYLSQATFEDAGIYLPAFMVGVITSLFAIMLVVSFLSTRGSAKRVLEQVQSDSEHDVGLIGVNAFDDVLKTGNATQLNDLLVSLNSNRRQQSVLEQEQHHRRRVEVANQMLTKALSEPQRQKAIVSKIDALAVIYGLDLLYGLKKPNVAATLATTAKSYIKDGNAEIARAARMAMLKHDAFEMVKVDQKPDLQPVADQVIALLRDYPDDESMSAVKMIVAYYNLRNDRNGSNTGLVLMEKIQSGAGSLDSPQAIELLQSFTDASKLQAVGYEKSFLNRWVNGPVGEIKMVDSSLKLIADPQAGIAILAKVDMVAHWFEQENQYVRTASIYQAMLNAADTYESPAVATLARKMAEDGLRRTNLVNEKIEFGGVLADLEPLDPSLFVGKSTVVLFWSSNNSDSVEAVTQVNRDTIEWRKKGGMVLAVCIDPVPGKNSASMVTASKGFVFAISDEGRGNGNPMLEQCPSSRTPRALLVDRKGIVVDVNVPIPEIKTEATYLMSRPR